MGKRRKRLTMKRYAKKYASVRRALGLIDEDTPLPESATTPEPVVAQEEVVVPEVKKEETTRKPKNTRSKKSSNTTPRRTRETFHEIVHAQPAEEPAATATPKSKRASSSRTKTASTTRKTSTRRNAKDKATTPN
jgi:cell envelope opacity-associated protein A